jgi:threonyl-tRNA synthetase
MGKELSERWPEARQAFEEANEMLGYDLADICFNGTLEQITQIADRHIDYAYKIRQELLNVRLNSSCEAIRVEIDEARESMQKKIRNAQLQKIPYMLVVGDKEAENGTVALRHRSGSNLGTLSLDAVAERIKAEILTRADLPLA